MVVPILLPTKSVGVLHVMISQNASFLLHSAQTFLHTFTDLMVVHGVAQLKSPQLVSSLPLNTCEYKNV